MSNKIKLQIPTQSFKSFLRGISKISPSVIIKVKDYKMEVLTTSDGGAIIMLSTLSLPAIDDNKVEIELPIIDITKLMKICDFATEENLILEINDNIIKYKNDIIKLKFYLAEKSIINVPAQVTSDRFRSFPITFSTTLDRNVISQLEKGFGFVKSTSGDIKIYFYIEDNILYGELTDYTSQATDSFRVALTTSYAGDLNGRIPIKFDNWSLTDLPNNEVMFETAVVKRKSLTYNILFIRQTSADLEYSYLIQGLKN